MSIPRSNIEYAKGQFFPRVGNDYVYGGMWSPSDVHQGTDCSGIWNDLLSALVAGKIVWGREREGATTESYRYVGGPGSLGPFGTRRLDSPGAAPGDAAAHIALHHGPGGGANSHMWGEFSDGTGGFIRAESQGSLGAVTGSNARAFTNSYANDWFYLPGPVIGAAGDPLQPAPDIIYLGIGYEDSGERVLALQRRLNQVTNGGIEEDGEFGPMTDRAVRLYQNEKGLIVDGIAGPATLISLGLFQPATTTPAPRYTESWQAVAGQLL